MSPLLKLVTAETESDTERLDAVFSALADPTRRMLLEQLGQSDQLVSELAEAHSISLQAISRHIQVLVRAGLVSQARSGRVSRCTLDAGPMVDVAVWINRYTHYWQAQFNALAATLESLPPVRRNPEHARHRTGRKRER